MQRTPRKRKERHYEQDFLELLNVVTDFEETKLLLTGRLGRIIKEHDRNPAPNVFLGGLCTANVRILSFLREFFGAET